MGCSADALREWAGRYRAEGNGGQETAQERAEVKRLREQLAKKNNVIAELAEEAG
jgi:hypothetical protein